MRDHVARLRARLGTQAIVNWPSVDAGNARQYRQAQHRRRLVHASRSTLSVQGSGPMIAATYPTIAVSQFNWLNRGGAVSQALRVGFETECACARPLTPSIRDASVGPSANPPRLLDLAVSPGGSTVSPADSPPDVNQTSSSLGERRWFRWMSLATGSGRPFRRRRCLHPARKSL